MHHDGGNLTILHLSQEDRGSYECVASNAVANAITTTLLLIESTSAVCLLCPLDIGFLMTTHNASPTSKMMMIIIIILCLVYVTTE